MSLLKDKSFSASDYAALGISICLAFIVWLLHGLSQDYSDVVQCQVTVRCELAGHSNVSAQPTSLSARCEMNGFSLMGYKIHDRKVTVDVAPEDMRHARGDRFFMTSADLTKYFYDIFPDNAHLEYFTADTVNFIFNAVKYKKVPVKAACTLNFEPQYTAMGPVRMTPDSVLVYGPQDLLDAVDVVNTKVFHLENLNGETFGEVEIEPIKKIRISAEKVSYSLSVTRYVEREYVLPVVMEGVPARTNVTIFPSTTTVRLKCVFPSKLNLRKDHVTVKYSDFVAGRSGKCLGTLEHLPSSVLDCRIEPEVFDCFIQN